MGEAQMFSVPVILSLYASAIKPVIRTTRRTNTGKRLPFGPVESLDVNLLIRKITVAARKHIPMISRISERRDDTKAERVKLVCASSITRTGRTNPQNTMK